MHHSDFETQCVATIRHYNMLSPGDTIIVGLSGGADSVALVTILQKLKSEYKLRVVAAHVNHGLRGAEAVRDERFAEDYARLLGIEFRVLHADVQAIASDSGESFEECGRRIRYEFFAELANEFSHYAKRDGGCVKIATAHNAQDVVETMIFNLSRGTGLKGLCGIPPVRTLSEVSDILIIRPLIECTRDDIESYLKQGEILYMTDSTNADTDYSRNRIRQNVLPELVSLNPGAVRNMARCIDTLREDEAYLDTVAYELLERARFVVDAYVEASTSYDAATLLAAAPAIRSRAIAQALRLRGIRPERLHVDSVCALLSGGGKTQVSGALTVAVSRGLLSFSENSEVVETPEIYKEICLKNAEYTDNFLGASITLKVLPYDTCNEKNKPVLENKLDYDKIIGKFVLRNRRDGDKFELPKRNITKTLKNLFNEAKVPPNRRSALLMLEHDGELCFIESFGPAKKYAVTDTTKQVLTIEIVRS